MAAYTLLVSKPSMLRYLVFKVDGAAVTRALGTISDAKTANTLFGDMSAGPLKQTFKKLRATWNTGETPDATNPAGNARITTTITPLTLSQGAFGTSAALRYYDAGAGVNTLEVLGGKPSGTTDAAETNCIVEIRFNHSLE